MRKKHSGTRETNKVAVIRSPKDTRILEAVEELQLRRTARRSLIRFTEATHPRYIANWHHKVIAEYLEKLSWGKLDVDGLMVFAPPRHGKSEEVAVRWPPFDLGSSPDSHFITVAYGDELAATFSRAARNIVESPPYQRLWRHVLKTRGDTKWELKREHDDQRASYISSGILSALTGEGATRLIIDDPVKNAEEAYSQKIRDKIWDNYRTAATTRLSPGGKKVVIMTRWHTDDLAGRLLKLAQEDKKADQWLVLSFAAINDDGEQSFLWNTRTGERTLYPPYRALWPEFFPREELERTRSNIGSVYWNSLYMQRPTSPSGEIFKRENWGWYDAEPAVDYIVQVWDGACEEGQENDYSASITLGSTGTTFPVLDAWRDKVTFPYLMAKVYERWEQCAKLHGRYPDRLLVENKSSGVQIAQQVEANNMVGKWTFPNGETKRVPPVPVVRVPAQQSKEIRARGISGYHESKLILLPRKADWVIDFVDEHALFDKGPHDDWVDCTVHGVTYYVRPVEEFEQDVVYYEPAQVSSDLDEFDLREQLGNW